MRFSNIKNYKLLIIKSILLPAIFLNGCLSVKPTTTKSGKKFYDTFYVGEDGTQYFVKPISLENKMHQEQLTVDFTFRYKDQIKDSATVNFSINSIEIYKQIDSLHLQNRNIETKNSQIKLLFNESQRKKFISRYSLKISLKELKEIFDNDEWVITLHSSNKSIEYGIKQSSKKAINTIKDRVFVLM
jgi:hypothetical protein